MLRIPSSQPPTELTTIVAAGSSPWYSALARNGPLNPMVVSKEYPPAVGSSCHVEPNRNTSTSPSQKYGIAARKVVVGTSPSSQLPRRQPATVPSPTPSANDSSVASPTRASVQGRAWRRIV